MIWDIRYVILERMAHFANTVSVSAAAAPATRDPRIQEGWDTAKEGADYVTLKTLFEKILRNVKSYDGKPKYPYNSTLGDGTIGSLAELLSSELDSRDKLFGNVWSSSGTIVFSREMAGSNWPAELPYPTHKGEEVVFHMAGTIGSNRFREAVNEKILGELGLSGCFIRTYPSYKRWDKRKDGGKRKDSYGFLLNEDGKKIPIISDKNGTKNQRWDVSIVKKNETHTRKQTFCFAGSDSDEE